MSIRTRQARKAALVLASTLSLPLFLIPTMLAGSASAAPRGYCNQGVNAGVADDGGSQYWGWCHPNGKYVAYHIHVECPKGGGGDSAVVTGEGSGVVYTASETCWFGQRATKALVVND
jgi:hypothetical protein